MVNISDLKILMFDDLKTKCSYMSRFMFEEEDKKEYKLRHEIQNLLKIHKNGVAIFKCTGYKENKVWLTGKEIKDILTFYCEDILINRVEECYVIFLAGNVGNSILDGI